MGTIRSTRISVTRLANAIRKGDVSIVTLTCAIIFGILFISLVTTSASNQPVVLTSIQKKTYNMQQIQKESINTILIESDDGGVYIAFQIPKNSNVIGEIRNVHTQALNKVEKQSPTTSLTNTASKKTIKYNINKQQSKAGTQLKTKSGIAIHPKAPLTVFSNPYKLNNENVCKGVQNLAFVVLVHSATTHFMRRIAIRETWADIKLFKNRSFRIVFLLGEPEKDSTQALIEHENTLYGDVVQGNFIDSYHNLTHKGVLGIRWVAEYCSNAKIVVKVDDDVFLNVFQLLDDIENKYANKTKEIMCPVRLKGTSLIQRDSGKWKIDGNEFKNMTHYPITYCNGYFAIITADMIQQMFEAAKSTPLFWVDDVYVYGLLPDKIGNVTFTPLYHLNLIEKKAIECFESKKTKCELLVSSTTTEGVMDKLWYYALEQYKDLAKKYSGYELFKTKKV